MSFELLIAGLEVVKAGEILLWIFCFVFLFIYFYMVGLVFITFIFGLVIN